MIWKRNRLRCAVTWAALLTLLTGCSGGALMSQRATDEVPISPQLQIPSLRALPDRGSLTIKQLERGLLQFANEGQDDLADRLAALYAQWQVKPPLGTASIIEVDLDGDGVNEIITALSDTSSAVGSGTVFIIYKQDGAYLVDRVPTTVIRPGLHLTHDLNQDGRQEIIWSSTSTGANTPFTTLFVATWQRGQVEFRPTGITMSNAEVVMDGDDLLMVGGLGGGYGAGALQRVRTDRYAWQDEEFVLIDQSYAASPYSYHRLQDGILAEQWQRTEEAIVAYQQAMEPEREVALMEDNVPPAWQEEFTASVRRFAQFRLEMLLGQPNRETACQTAIDWAEEHPDFLKALNSPRGWANPMWEPADLCGPLPNLKRGQQP